MVLSTSISLRHVVSNFEHMLDMSGDVPHHVSPFNVRVEIFLFNTLVSTMRAFYFQILMYSKVVAHCWRVGSSEWAESTFIRFFPRMSSDMVPHILPIIGVIITTKTRMSEWNIRSFSNRTRSTVIQNDFSIIWKWNRTFFARECFCGWKKRIELVTKEK